MKSLRENFLRRERSERLHNLKQQIALKEQTLERRNASNNKATHDWTNVYKSCESWEDTDELKSALDLAREEEKKLSRSIILGGNGEGDHHQPSCMGMHKRDAEMRVARMTLAERLDEMKKFRSLGNLSYGEGRYNASLSMYEKALIYYEYCICNTVEEQGMVDAVRLPCLLNSAACHLKLGSYADGIESCTDAIGVYDGCPKAFFRRAQLRRINGNLDEAESDITNAIKLGGRKAVFLREKARLKADQRKHNVSIAIAAKRMWGPAETKDAEVSGNGDGESTHQPGFCGSSGTQQQKLTPENIDRG